MRSMGVGFDFQSVCKRIFLAFLFIKFLECCPPQCTPASRLPSAEFLEATSAGQ